MKSNLLLSILIPTKNRVEYSIKVAKHILSYSNLTFELVLQDNGSSNQLELELIRAKLIDDTRLQYHYTNEDLSFVGNFSMGIERCSGEYVLILGDDDTINPNIFAVVEWASTHNIEAITPTLPLVYNWPSSGVNAMKESGYLDVVNFNSSAFFYNTRHELVELLKNGCQNYLDYNLVKVYHGLVKKSRLDEIKNKLGFYIGGLSPDIYLSVSLSILINKVLVIDYPLTISGICNKSGSADSATGKHVGELSQAPHFKGHKSYNWNPRVPKFYSVETIWADSALAAITDMKEDALIQAFSISSISAYCYCTYPAFKNVMEQNIVDNINCKHNSYMLKFILLTGILKNNIHLLKRKVINRLNNKTKMSYFENVTDIENAVGLIQTLLSKRMVVLTKALQMITKK